LQVNNETYEFGRVPRRDAKHSDKPAAFKSFKKAREVRAEASFGEHQIEIHCRVTARKEGKWYLWFRANQVGQIRQPSDGGDSANESAWDKLKRIFPDE
jgi:hypothetical protein